MTDADAAKAGLLDHICHDEGSACPSCADFRAAIAAIEALQAERDAAICRANEHEDRADLLENRWVIDTGKLTIRAEKAEDEIEALQAENHRLALCLVSDASRAVGVMLSCELDPVILDDDPRGYIRRVYGLVQDEGRKLQRAIAEALTTQEKPE